MLVIVKTEIHMNMCFIPNGYRERAVCISRLSFTFLFVRLDEKRSLQNKGGYTKRIFADINKREDQLRRTTRDLRTRVAKCTEVDGGIFERLL